MNKMETDNSVYEIPSDLKLDETITPAAALGNEYTIGGNEYTALQFTRQAQNVQEESEGKTDYPKPRMWQAVSPKLSTAALIFSSIALMTTIICFVLIFIQPGTGSDVEDKALTCEGLSPPDNGEISVAPGPNSLSRGLGSVATYSCHPDYALVEQTTNRTCEDTVMTTRTWKEMSPSCQDILCLEPSVPQNMRRITLSFQLPNVGTTATYSCDPDYVQLQKITRTCEDTNGGTVTTGTWSGRNQICATINNAVIDCHKSACNSEHLLCPEWLQNNCTIECRHGNCLVTNVTCPSRGGECTLNCNDCRQTNIRCPQGNCHINCDSCQDLTANCSGGNCLINCEKESTCQRAIMECTSGNCTLNCSNSFSCQSSTVLCSPDGHCNIYCGGDFTCWNSYFTCPVGGNCLFHFEGLRPGNDWIGGHTAVTCRENSNCLIVCAGKDGDFQHQCFTSNITCPRRSGNCTVVCSGHEACRESEITCGPNRDCLDCSGEYSCDDSIITLSRESTSAINCTGRESCQRSTITCPANHNCTITCGGENSCNDATVTCPYGDYSCNILCTDPRSCFGLSITNTHNVYLQCCGSQTRCALYSVTPASTECQ